MNLFNFLLQKLLFFYQHFFSLPQLLDRLPGCRGFFSLLSTSKHFPKKTHFEVFCLNTLATSVNLLSSDGDQCELKKSETLPKLKWVTSLRSYRVVRYPTEFLYLFVAFFVWVISLFYFIWWSTKIKVFASTQISIAKLVLFSTQP